MNWLMPMLARIGVQNIVFPIVVKRVVAWPSRTTNLFLQYSICFLLSVLLAFYFGHLSFTPVFGGIILLGFLSAFGTFCQWQAIGISLSMNSVLTFLDDIIAITLAYVFLHEDRGLSAGAWIGISLCLLAVIGIARLENRKARSSQDSGGDQVKTRLNPKIFFWIAGYSVIWGLAIFLHRVYALTHLPITDFLVAWYGGSVIAAGLLFLFVRRHGRKGSKAPENSARYSQLILLAGIIMAARATDIWSLQAAPLTIVQPIAMVAELVFPALIGLLIFRERHQFSGSQKACFAVAALGGLIVALSYTR